MFISPCDNVSPMTHGGTYGECLPIVLLSDGHNSEIFFTPFSLISKAENYLC